MRCRPIWYVNRSNARSSFLPLALPTQKPTLHHSNGSNSLGTDLHSAIGVFDSGIGGLSILKALRATLPYENFVYVADSGHAPYGERDANFVVERTRAIAHHLLSDSTLCLKALVIACNTATAAAIHLLRQDDFTCPIIVVEPALKPALTLSKTRRIGVMATRATLNSHKFKTLLASMSGQSEFICQPCDGLATAIEHDDTSKIIALCADYTGVMGRFGIKKNEIDTLVLGCTHYPFAAAHLQLMVGTEVHLVDTGEPVARHTAHLLTSRTPHSYPGQLALRSSGDPFALSQATQRWLGLQVETQRLTI